MPATSHSWLRYLAAPVAVGTALAIKLLLVPLVTEDSPFILFFLAVMLVAWYGGLGPGILATGIAVIANNYYFMRPFGGFDWVTPALQFRTLLFCVEGLCVSILCDRLQLARRRIERNAEDAHELERQLLEVSDAEQRRISHDLHDGLGAQLTGVALLAKRLENRLTMAGLAECSDAAKISELARSAMEWTHDLCRSLSPTVLETEGLTEALRELCANAESLFGIRCRLETAGNVSPLSVSAAVHLYRISQEAISNAVKHGRARDVRLRLEILENLLVLTVKDDGTGLAPRPGESDGMGLRIMRYRAKMIGASMEMNHRPDGGTSVICVLGPEQARGALTTTPQYGQR